MGLHRRGEEGERGMLLSYCLWGFIMLGAISYKTSIEHSKQRKIYIVVISILLILYMGLRGDFLTDYSAMVGIYKTVLRCSIQDILTWDFHLNTEGIGFALLMRFCNDMFGVSGILAFMILSAVLIVIPLSVIIYKYSAYPYISFLVYISIGTYFEGFNITQQMVAASIAFAGVVLFRRNKVFGIILTVIAVFFHISAVIMFGYYLIATIKSRAKQILLLIVGLMSAFNANRIASIFGLIVYKKQYALNSHYDLNSVGIPLLIASFFVALFFISSQRMKLYDISTEYYNGNSTVLNVVHSMNFWINGTITWIVFLVFELFVALATRFASFFMPYVMIVIPNLIYKNTFNERSKRVFQVLFVFLLSFYYLYASSRIIWNYISIFN